MDSTPKSKDRRVLVLFILTIAINANAVAEELGDPANGEKLFSQCMASFWLQVSFG